MKESKTNSDLELLKEKYARHEKILIQAYKSIKLKEAALVKLNADLKTSREVIQSANEELKASEEEIQAANEELRYANEELNEKNELINLKNDELQTTLENLKETQAQLLQVDKMASLGILTAGVAHEINNPLNYINCSYQGLHDHFLNHPANENEGIQFYLDSIKVGVDKVAEIVQGLNQFSRDNDAKDEDCDIHAILDNCLVMMHGQLKQNIKVVKKYANTNVTIKGNIGKLHQALINIISNAYQSIDSVGSITITTKVSKKAFKIEIEDTGTGICMDNMNKITDPFFSTKDPGKGTGLGLSITYNIVKAHNGKLIFSSMLGKGTTVTIELPIGD